MEKQMTESQVDRSSRSSFDQLTIHVVFKTHLDIGFTDMAANVERQYLDSFIPKALDLAEALRHDQDGHRFRWTTGSWIIDRYLEEAGAAERQRMEEAIAAGDISWHALPFTTHTELMDASLFRYGLEISARLDRRFGKKTVAAKMTDVPGHTKAMIPLLSEAGVRLLHLGANPVSMPPDVPHAFKWRYAEGQEVVVIYEKGQYGGLYMDPSGRVALVVAHTNDNIGPPSISEIKHQYETLMERYPGAKVVASTLDEFAISLLQNDPALPMVTEELGDSWIHGVGSDPTKVRHYRELCRLRNEWETGGEAEAYPDAFEGFGRQLLMVPEHTWGLDVKTHLGDTDNFSEAKFADARASAPFQKMEASWAEQRAYVTEAVERLKGTPLYDEAKKRLDAMDPVVGPAVDPADGPVVDPADGPVVDPSSESAADMLANQGFAPIDGHRIETDWFEAGFDPTDGSITHLVEKPTGRTWAGPENPLGRLMYETFCGADFDRFMEQYFYTHRPEVLAWALSDFGRPGMDQVAGRPEDRMRCGAKLERMVQKSDARGTEVWQELSLSPDHEAAYGAPRKLVVRLFFEKDTRSIEWDLMWTDKRASRIAEAMWVSLVPIVATGGNWKLEKMGRLIDPGDVIQKGSRTLHAVGQYVIYTDDQSTLKLETKDAPLVAPGKPSLLDFHDQLPKPEDGIHVNLFNNVWGTNFPQWIEGDARFRFRLLISGEG